MALVENKMFNLLININSFLEQPIKANKKRKNFWKYQKTIAYNRKRIRLFPSPKILNTFT